ncbi:MAG: hypothetical protein FJY85_02425 [Deltaproteobacteria bacterium]|nr:hypothetical protein [Deltaproteobacteria bacterium]
MPEVNGIIIKKASETQWDLRPGTGNFNVLGLDPNTNYQARLVGPQVDLKTLASTAPSAPARVSDPQITGTGLIGDTITLAATGSVSGVPTPNPGAPIWQYRIDENASWETISGQAGNTYTPTSGSVTAGGRIRAGVPYTNDSGTITLWSNELELSEMPQITAVLNLNPVDQQSQITFNTDIKGLPTITQGQTVVPVVRDGTTNRWLFIARAQGPISFTAIKDGWKTFNLNATVDSALSALVERDYEIMLQGDPGSEPVIFEEPQEYAGSYVTPDSSLTNGMANLVEAVVSRSGDAVTTTRDPLFTWDDSIEPIQFGHAYYRGTTALDATLIEGTEGVAIYTVDPVLDGGKNIYRRDWMEGAGSDSELAVFSNGIAVAAPANWWVPDSIVDVDFQNNRARINGVSYASIEAARTANAIKTSPTGVDYSDVSGLGTSYVLAAKGITADVNQTQILAALDDGDDGITNDEIVYVGRHFANNEYRAALFSQAGNSSRLGSITSPLLSTSSPVRMAVRAKSGNYYGMVNGVAGASSAASGALPAVNRVAYGKRSVASELSWTGAVHRVVVINADLTNDQINALLA